MTTNRFNNEVLPLRHAMYAATLPLVRNSDEASDIVQDTMLTLWESRERLDKIDNITGYCLTACRRKALDILRRRNSLPHTPLTELADSTDSTPLCDEQLSTRQAVSMVRQQIERLPEQQRTALSLSVFSALDNTDIAQTMGISEGNVRVLLSRARHKLRQLFLQSNR